MWNTKASSEHDPHAPQHEAAGEDRLTRGHAATPAYSLRCDSPRNTLRLPDHVGEHVAQQHDAAEGHDPLLADGRPPEADEEVPLVLRERDRGALVAVELSRRVGAGLLVRGGHLFFGRRHGGNVAVRWPVRRDCASFLKRLCDGPWGRGPERRSISWRRRWSEREFARPEEGVGDEAGEPAQRPALHRLVDDDLARFGVGGRHRDSHARDARRPEAHLQLEQLGSTPLGHHRRVVELTRRGADRMVEARADLGPPVIDVADSPRVPTTHFGYAHRVLEDVEDLVGRGRDGDRVTCHGGGGVESDA